MELYFEEVFENLDRDALISRVKRKELVEYFNTVIDGCAKGCTFFFLLNNRDFSDR